LAARAGHGIKQHDISRWEHGVVTLPRWHQLVTLAAALEVTPGVLLVSCYGAGADFAEFTQRPGLRVSMGTFEDGTRVVSVFDTADDRFGWAFNLDVPDFTEWGCAPDPNWREQAA
jgi:hypothetical protein